MQAEKCVVGGQKASWGLSGWCQHPLAPIPVELLRVPVLIWISDLSSLPCCRPEELMKQPLEDVFLFLHRVLSRRSTAASVESCYVGHGAAPRSYRCPKCTDCSQGSFGKVAGMWGAGGGAGPMAQRGRTRGRCLASPGTGAWCRPPLVAPIRGYHGIWLISRSLPSCNLPIRPSDRAGFVTRNHEHLSWQLEQNLQRRRDKSQAGSFLNVQPARTGT